MFSFFLISKTGNTCKNVAENVTAHLKGFMGNKSQVIREINSVSICIFNKTVCEYIVECVPVFWNVIDITILLFMNPKNGIESFVNCVEEIFQIVSLFYFDTKFHKPVPQRI